MPKKPWEPLPHEADLFHNVYIDESSQQHKRLVYGALILPMSHADQFEADIITARGEKFKPIGHDGLMKWRKVSAPSLVAYKRVVDAFFLFAHRRNLPFSKDIVINCLAVDTGLKAIHDRKYSGADADLGMDKDIYHLCVRDVARRFKTALFHVYPDRRTTNLPRHKALHIMNYGMRKYGDKRDFPFRRLRFADPETTQALQVVDIVIGAVAYRLNRHYEHPDATPAKKQLCDYILLERAKIADAFVSTPYHQRQLRIWHRQYQHLTES